MSAEARLGLLLDKFDRIRDRFAQAQQVVVAEIDMLRSEMARLAAPPAPPVATTGAVPRDAIRYLYERISGWRIKFHDLWELGELTTHWNEVGRWLDGLSAAPAPKKYRCRACGEVSEGEPDCCNYGTQNPEVVAPAPKASEGERCPTCGNKVEGSDPSDPHKSACSAVGEVGQPGCICLAQPHARAEGATGGIPVSEALDWPEHRSWCVHHKGERCDCGRNAAEEVLRRALSGSAEGRP